MPERDWTIRIEDILEAISRIRRYTEGMKEREFRENELVQDALIRNFAVIGEAARHIPEEVRDRYPEVPWIRMSAMRNLVVHEYFGVDLRIIWDTVHEDLPNLAEDLEEIRGSGNQ